MGPLGQIEGLSWRFSHLIFHNSDSLNQYHFNSLSLSVLKECEQTTDTLAAIAFTKVSLALGEQ